MFRVLIDTEKSSACMMDYLHMACVQGHVTSLLSHLLARKCLHVKRKIYVAYNFHCHIENDVFLVVAGSHINCKWLFLGNGAR